MLLFLVWFGCFIVWMNRCGQLFFVSSLHNSVFPCISTVWCYIKSSSYYQHLFEYQWGLLILVCSQSFTVARQWCLFIVSSSGTYIWSRDWGDVYFSWCLYRILAWGMHFSYRIHIHLNTSIWWWSFSGCQIINWRHWRVETNYLLCCSTCTWSSVYRYILYIH